MCMARKKKTYLRKITVFCQHQQWNLQKLNNRSNQVHEAHQLAKMRNGKSKKKFPPFKVVGTCSLFSNIQKSHSLIESCLLIGKSMPGSLSLMRIKAILFGIFRNIQFIKLSHFSSWYFLADWKYLRNNNQFYEI